MDLRVMGDLRILVQRLFSPNGKFHRPGIFHPLGSVQDFHTDDIPILIVVDDDARLVLIAFFYGGAAEKEAQDIHLRVIGDLHGFPPAAATPGFRDILQNQLD